MVTPKNANAEPATIIQRPPIKALRDTYPVKVSAVEMGGVYTEVFEPTEGVSDSNRDKVLINLHGGGFQIGSRSTSHTESIPIAALGKIRVISIDYQLAPEYQFPAASIDVGKVYQQLLKQYSPKNIGLYGCSAGAMLTAQSIAHFIELNLPMPGAIGLLCGGAPQARMFHSDSSIIGGRLAGYDLVGYLGKNPYFKGVSKTKAVAFPGDFNSILSHFPPALLISGTRDFALSSVITTHSKLRSLGRSADLFVFEGMDHAFHYYHRLPESQSVYRILVEFFEKELGSDQ